MTQQLHNDIVAVLEQMRKGTAELKQQADTIERLAKSLEILVAGQIFKRANVAPTPTKPAQREGIPYASAGAATGPLRPRDTTPGAVIWRPFKTGTPGDWCHASENQPLRDTLLAAQEKTVVLENYTYHLSGDQDQFMQRFPVGSKK